jgi:hypothetical protein
MPEATMQHTHFRADGGPCLACDAEMRDGIPHPWYGPCDAFGPHGFCVECRRVTVLHLDEITRLTNERDHWRQHFENAEQGRATLEAQHAGLVQEIKALRAQRSPFTHEDVKALRSESGFAGDLDGAPKLAQHWLSLATRIAGLLPPEPPR